MLVCVSVAVTVAPGTAAAACVGDVAEQRAGDGLRGRLGRKCANEQGSGQAQGQRAANNGRRGPA